MSLTKQLAADALDRWCADTNLTGTPRLAAEVADDPDHGATIGGALGQRLAFATHHAPPYYALLGAHHAGLADWATVHRAAARFRHREHGQLRSCRPG